MQKTTVVVAEDDQEIRRSLVEILLPIYAVVAAVPDGEQLVDAVRRLRPDAAVVDLAMPVLSGLDALRRLQAEGIQLKTVIISAHADPAYVRRALQLGAQGYVSKAAGTEDLLRALEAAFEGRTFLSSGIKTIPEREP